MFTLTFTDPAGRTQSVPLVNEEGGVVVGRDPGCDVVMQSKEVSRRHARFFVRAGDLLVEDLGSHNGVYVAGAKIEKATAIIGTPEIELGDVRVAVGAIAPRAPRALPALPARSGQPGAGPDAGRARSPSEQGGEAAPPQGSARAGALAARARAAKSAQARGEPKSGKVAAAGAEPVGAPASGRGAGSISAGTRADRRAAAGAGEEGAGRGVGAGSRGAGAGYREEGAGSRGVGAGAVLRGLGKNAAVQIRLPPRAVVGRAADCDVVLDDDSVSRQHAELSRDERGLYRLSDLDSANGTFLDGRRVSAAELVPDGARLRFGDVELLFWRPPGNSAGSRPRTLLFAGAALVLVFGALYLLKERRRAQREADEQAWQQSPEDESATLTEQAQAAIESDRYEEAVHLAQQSLDKDPLAQLPRKLLVQARKEQLSARTFNEANAKAQVGNADEALHLYAQVDPQSRYFARARIRAKEVAQGALRTHGRACAADAGRERWQGAAVECARALDVKCQLGEVDKDPLLKALRQAERALSRRVPWSCPPDLAPLFHDAAPADPAAVADADKAMRARYPDAALRDAVAQYARGEVAPALRALSDPTVTRGKNAAQAAQVVEKIRLADGRFREGQTSLLRSELSKADELWSEALQADAALLPPGMDGFLGGQMRATLSQAHAKAGDERFGKGQYASAFDEWSKGLVYAPRDPHLSDSLARLEKVAEGILGSSPSCDQLQTALHITRTDPASPAHSAAAAALDACK